MYSEEGDYSETTVISTIIAGNSNNDDVIEEGLPIISGGNNLIGNGDTATGFSDGVNGDLVGTAGNPIDPLLAPLADNGGFLVGDPNTGQQTILTHALLRGSPAIDAGSNPEGLSFDERGEGFDRVADNSADIGAFELINSVPVAVDDAVTTDEDTLLAGIEVLGNDTDTDGDALSIASFDTTGTLGIVTDNGDGTFDYDPNGQFEALNTGDTATDSFTYTIDDGNGGTDTATVTITIDGVDDNTAPDAVDDAVTTDEDTLLAGIEVLGNDTDADGDTLSIASFDTTGTIGIVTDNGDGTFDYDPNGQFEALNTGDTATDSFTYTIDDGNGGTDTATVTITIDGVDDVAPSSIVINEVDADTPSFDQAEFIETHFRTFKKPMGIAADSEKIALGSGYQIWELRNCPAVATKLEPHGKHDACYLPRQVQITGDIDIHEMMWVEEELWFINTKFSCLCTLDRPNSFVPRWRPSFITGYDLSDRCHLNGFCLKDGKPKYISALGETDTPGGWRKNKVNGGILIDIETNEILLRGLSMPHSPRWYREQLWLLESGKGSLAKVDLQTGKLITIAQMPGFTRGIEFWGDLAFIGLSQVRETAVFSGMEITRLPERFCGVWVININTGETVAFLRFEEEVQEIFAVSILPGIRFPEIIDCDEALLASTYILPDIALKETVPENTEQAEMKYHFARGNQLYQQQKLVAAISEYQECLKLQPVLNQPNYA